MADYMRRSGEFGRIGENLNDGAVRGIAKRHEKIDVLKFFSVLHNRFNKDAKIFGVKASSSQIAMLHRYGAFGLFRGVRVVHIQRHDVIAQAVSFSIADQTKKWTSEHQGVGDDVQYDAADILGRMQSINAENGRITEICSILQIPKLDVAYEDLEQRPLLQIKRVFRHFGLDPSGAKVSAPGIKKQSSDLNEKFCARFRAEMLRNLPKA
ncbi:Stf0 family sulfotransferase [Cribrihabitans marinus]|uniref:Stf0 family sulfotransferase n=1 Tax=Cribrihabitans marinus TaxID=1227549 RepID=UPI0015A5CB50|nr:Stf0 family sulfotransferase [Cribrihabitans marinus]